VYGPRIDIGAVESQPILSTVMGDYDQSGVVDAGDYMLWRKTLGTTGLTPYTGADGSGNGTVDEADLRLWRAHYGSIVPGTEVVTIDAKLVDSEAPISLARDRVLFQEVRTNVPTLPGARRARGLTNPVGAATVLSDGALIDYLASRGEEHDLDSYEPTTDSDDCSPELANEAVELAFAGVAGIL
jgi:hypothetical protein